ncbi:hypothetical protein [Endozoicomonas sp. SCSIO W0465]|uniref:hypothetical protein n=1 Tax=Endozoicomonas sp. SCSIO W0465 TaxID=2918516 RepID=UPI002075A975|nr:hypothetical protein [Endozoicomonas sp. SCSIO W0465]USE38543.1 hypothetical protein MJO57_10440 [Endozoicomonas sp. SCSIO W0465]
MQTNGISGHNPVQIANSAGIQDVQQESSISSKLQKLFYYYDPESGTRYKLGNTAMTIAGFSAAGAVAMLNLAPQLSTIADRGTSLIERVVQHADSFFLNNPIAPVAIGAAVGAAGGLALVNLFYQEGLKPRTEGAIRPIMHGLIFKMESNYKAIQYYKRAIENNNALLKAKKRSMLLEKEESQRKAETVFKQNMEAYNRTASNVAGELDGYLNAVFDQLKDPDRLPSYEEAVSGLRRQGDFQLGRDVSSFIRNGNYSLRAQNNLIKKLIPHLTERELNNVKSILRKFPWKPVLLPLPGPIEQEYENIATEKVSNTHKMGAIEREVRKLTELYPILSVNAEGEVKIPSIAEFSNYLPK